ncbi:UNVERIFIED_CONTAM: hypothetical protein HDU68_000954 [Siphonaria sp. JEL0065]|nr:hypothetical protein HDU68_000954 [Siphonaria sp. JEL0065]
MGSPGRKIVFANVLRDEIGPPYSLAAFRQYLTCVEYSIENLDFWEACIDYRKNYVPGDVPAVPAIPSSLAQEGIISPKQGGSSPNNLSRHVSATIDPATFSLPASARPTVASHLSNAYSFKSLLDSVDFIGDYGGNTIPPEKSVDFNNQHHSDIGASKLPLPGTGNDNTIPRKPSTRVTKVKDSESSVSGMMQRSKSLDHRGLESPTTQPFQPQSKKSATDLLNPDASAASLASNAKVNYAPLNDSAANPKPTNVTLTTLLMVDPKKESNSSSVTKSASARSSNLGSRSVFASLGSLANLTPSTWSLNGSNRSLNERALYTNDQKKKALEVILIKFFTEGGESEINVPYGMYERLATRVRDDNYYHPNVLKEVMEEVYLMMKNSSYPRFTKHIEQLGPSGSGSHIIDVGIGSSTPLSEKT